MSENGNERNFVMRIVQEFMVKNRKVIKIQLPSEFGFKGGDNVKLEKVNDNEIKIVKIT